MAPTLLMFRTWNCGIVGQDNLFKYSFFVSVGFIDSVVVTAPHKRTYAWRFAWPRCREIEPWKLSSSIPPSFFRRR